MKPILTHVFIEEGTQLFKELSENDLLVGDFNFNIWLKHIPSIGEFLNISYRSWCVEYTFSEYLKKNKRSLNLKITALMSECVYDTDENKNFVYLSLKCEEQDFFNN